MNPPEFDRAVEALRLRLPRSAIRSAVLFGSVARGTATEGSDIDLLVVPRSPEDERRILRTVREIEDEHRIRIATVFSSPSFRELDRQFLDSVIREGVLLAGGRLRVDVRDLDLEPFRLVAFDLRSLPQAKKVRLARELFGYETRKRVDRRTYVRRVEGRLAAWGGRKVNPGTVLIPEATAPELDRLLRSYGAKRMLVPLWLQRP